MCCKVHVPKHTVRICTCVRASMEPEQLRLEGRSQELSDSIPALINSIPRSSIPALIKKGPQLCTRIVCTALITTQRPCFLSKR